MSAITETATALGLRLSQGELRPLHGPIILIVARQLADANERLSSSHWTDSDGHNVGRDVLQAYRDRSGEPDGCGSAALGEIERDLRHLPAQTVQAVGDRGNGRQVARPGRKPGCGRNVAPALPDAGPAGEPHGVRRPGRTSVGESMLPSVAEVVGVIEPVLRGPKALTQADLVGCGPLGDPDGGDRRPSKAAEHVLDPVTLTVDDTISI